MNTSHLTTEELIHYVLNTLDERTELEVQLAQELMRLLDSGHFGDHD